MERGGGENVRQPRFGLTDVAALSYATPPDGLRLRALDSGALGVLGGELGGLLPLPCGLDCLVMGLRPDGSWRGASLAWVHAARTGHARQVAA